MKGTNDPAREPIIVRRCNHQRWLVAGSLSVASIGVMSVWLAWPRRVHDVVGISMFVTVMPVLCWLTFRDIKPRLRAFREGMKCCPECTYPFDAESGMVRCPECGRESDAEVARAQWTLAISNRNVELLVYLWLRRKLGRDDSDRPGTS